MTKLFIIVVTYNAQHWLPFFGDPLKDLPAGWKVIIVDNASADHTCALIEKNYPQFILIKSQRNLGFGRANNIGLKIALKEGADYAFLLNQDARISVTHIQRMVDIQRSHPEFYVISPIHFDGTGKELDLNFSNYALPLSCPNLYADALLGQLNDLYEGKTVNAAAWLLSRNCLMQIGGFNPLFTHYGEDDEYRNRVLHHGYKLGIVPAAFAFHDRANRPPKKILTFLAPSSLTKLLNLDINYSFFLLSQSLCKQCIKKLCLLKFDEFFYIVKIFLWFLLNKSKIKQSKAIIAKKGCHFLL